MTHHRAVAGGAQVVEESFGMVDGGLQVHGGRQPLSIQVFPAQGAPVTEGTNSKQISTHFEENNLRK